MTDEREISAEKLKDDVLYQRLANGIGTTDDQHHAADWIERLTAELSAASARAENAEERLRPGSPTERAPTQDAYEAACKALHAHRDRATAAEAENARLREVLKKAHAHLCDGESVSAAIVVEAALSPAPAIAPPPAPAPEASEEAGDVVQWVCALASVIAREVTDDDVEPVLKDQYAKALARALDAHRDGGGR